MTQYQFHLLIAVLASLWLHVAFFGAYHANQMLQKVLRTVGLVRPAATAPAHRTPTLSFVPVIMPAGEKNAPQIFMETDDRQATDTEPDATPFYSERATVAANPENPTKVEGDTPYIEGTETKILSTDNVPVPTPGAVALSRKRLEQARQAQAPPGAPAIPPAAPPAPAIDSPLGLTKPPPAPTPQQLAMTARPARPGAAPGAKPVPAAGSEGRTGIAFPGRDIASKQSRLIAGGVSRTGVTAFNVASSPFGAYDRKLIRTVQQRWYALIDRFGVYERAGTVTLHFELYDDGSIRNLQRRENTAGEILALYCEKAVTDAAPFDPLTDDLRRLVGNEAREVDFTFYY